MLNNNKSQEPLVSVAILTYNAKKYIKKCLGSVLDQTYPNIEIIVIDNNSSDSTVQMLQTISVIARSEATKQSQVLCNKDGIASSSCRPSRNDRIKIIQNKNNAGFAAGQNQGIRESKGKYVLCLNQDAWLDKDYIKNAAGVLEADDKIAAVQGKLFRYDWQNGKILPVIDTKGLVMLKNRRIINQDQGKKEDPNIKEEVKEIFGPDGAAPIYRREALEDIKLPKNFKDRNELFEYFDEDFFMYKEDVDLAWRLRLAGWKSVYVPNCLAYHGRGAGDSAAKNYADILRERRKISGLAKFYSWKNQRLMQIKNETAGNFIKHFPYFVVKEACSWLYVLLFEEPYAIKSIRKLFQGIPLAKRKREIIMARKRVSEKEIERWFE